MQTGLITEILLMKVFFGENFSSNIGSVTSLVAKLLLDVNGPISNKIVHFFHFNLIATLIESIHLSSLIKINAKRFVASSITFFSFICTFFSGKIYCVIYTQ